MLHLSYSSIQAYMHCPLFYKFKYHERLPEKPRGEFSLGNALHSALEFFYQGSEPPTIDALLEKYQSSWVSAGFKNKEEEKNAFHTGEEWLKRFWHAFANNYKKPLHVEYKFEIEIEDFVVMGTIDRIDRMPDGKIEIIDYKSGDATERDAALSLQLGIYQIAVERVLGSEIGQLTIFHIPTLTPLSSPPRTESEIAEVIQKMSWTAKGIRKKQFDPVRNEWCPCDYGSLCPYYRHLYAILHPEGKLLDMRRICSLVDTYAEWLLNRTNLDNTEKMAMEIRQFMHSYDFKRVYGSKYAIETRGNIFRAEEITSEEREKIM